MNPESKSTNVALYVKFGIYLCSLFNYRDCTPPDNGKIHYRIFTRAHTISINRRMKNLPFRLANAMNVKCAKPENDLLLGETFPSLQAIRSSRSNIGVSKVT